MNLPAILNRRPDPGDVKHALKARFDHVHYRAAPGGFSIEIIARDHTGRIRLRLPFFWSERLGWIYLIEKGERP